MSAASLRLPPPSGPRLLLLRHAKSDWSDPTQADIDRPLAPRGERASVLMGRYLRQLQLLPDLVLCSPARRTQETWHLLSGQFNRPSVPLIDDRLYAGGVAGYLQALSDHGPGNPIVLMIGHNPDLENLVQHLARDHDTDDRALAGEKLPTAALCVIDLGDRALTPDVAGGPLIHFVTPKMLV